jgi:hypothetical protein
MAKRAAKSKSKGKAPAVTLRYANPSRGRMAKKKKSSTKRRAPRRNPATKSNKGRRRRRNPGNMFVERAGRLAAGAAVAVATAIGVTYGAAKIMPGTKTSLYGIPALAFLAGAAIARTMPILGGGIALGAFAPFALPLSTKLLGATTPTTTTPASTPAVAASGIARAYRNMRAIDMGRGRGSMRAVDLGAVDMGSYAYR